jgi:cell division protein FtsA
LAIGLRISLESAEKIKLFLSEPEAKRALRPEAEEGKTSKKESDELDLSALNLPEEVRKVSQKTLIDGIIRPRLNEIFTMVGIEIKKSEFGGQTPAGLVITGGGALTIGAKDAAKRMLAMPVRAGVPQGLKGIIDEVQSPAYATVIGLLIYGSRFVAEKQLPFGITMPKIPGMGSSKVMRKITDLVKFFIP